MKLGKKKVAYVYKKEKTEQKGESNIYNFQTNAKS